MDIKTNLLGLNKTWDWFFVANRKIKYRMIEKKCTFSYFRTLYVKPKTTTYINKGHRPRPRNRNWSYVALSEIQQLESTKPQYKWWKLIEAKQHHRFTKTTIKKQHNNNMKRVKIIKKTLSFYRVFFVQADWLSFVKSEHMSRANDVNVFPKVRICKKN